MSKNSKLLPEGFCDLIFEKATKKYHDKNLVMDYFLQKDFKLIETSLLEFDDKSILANDAFVTYDALSSNNLIFRNDITLQIERLLNSRLKNCPKPLKLCYQGEVLSNNFADKKRQKTQAGIEIIGDKSQEADFEVIATILGVVKQLGHNNILIEISLPDLLDKFFSEAGIIDNVKADLSEAILAKNITKVREIIGDKVGVIEDIILDNSNLENNIDRFLKEFNSEILEAEFAKAKTIYSTLKNDFDGEICFDLFGDHKSLYHNSITFDIFVDGHAMPIARGGRYHIGDMDAIGASIYL